MATDRGASLRQPGDWPPLQPSETADDLAVCFLFLADLFSFLLAVAAFPAPVFGSSGLKASVFSSHQA